MDFQGLFIVIPIALVVGVTVAVYFFLAKVLGWRRLASILLAGVLLWVLLGLGYRLTEHLTESVHRSSLEEHYKRDLALRGYGSNHFKDPDTLRFRNIRVQEISRGADRIRKKLGLSWVDDLVCVSGEVNSRGGGGGYVGYKPISAFYVLDLKKRKEGFAQVWWGDLWRRVGTVPKKC